MTNKHTFRVMTAAVLSLAALTSAPEAAGGQLAHASASTLALGGAHTASARGFAAISVNPAGLGMPGSGFSLAILPVQARASVGPVTLSDLYEYQGQVVPASVAEEWVDRIAEAGGQSSLVGADVSGLALTFGNFGLQVSTTASSDLVLPAGVAEGLMLGNAGRTGSPEELDLTGLGVNAFASSTAGLSYAFPVGSAVFGVTGKYTVGHALGVARANSGAISSDPIRITLESPAIGPCDDELLGSCTESLGNMGSGFGADIGFMLELPTLTVGASIIDLFNTFSWDVEGLSYYPGTAVVEQGEAQSDFDETPFTDAPANIRAVVEDYTFRPTLRVGAAMDLPRELTVSGDIHHRVSEDGIALGPRSHVGVGAEWRGLGLVHLRGGLALISGGTQYSGGLSLVLGPVNLSVAGAARRGDTEGLLSQFTLSFGNR